MIQRAKFDLQSKPVHFPSSRIRNINPFDNSGHNNSYYFWTKTKANLSIASVKKLLEICVVAFTYLLINIKLQNQEAISWSKNNTAEAYYIEKLRVEACGF